MKESQNKTFKEILDNFLVLNLFAIIIGFIFLAISSLLSFQGYQDPYLFFQKLWFPFFVPVLSTFFTAVLVEFVLGYKRG
tara:strand:- start:154 stop:393 length:240 start_codon:yes stop_codon:yes gene_type:complete